MVANSKQMEDVGAKWTAAIAAHPTWYKPNAKDEIYKWQTSTEPLLTGEVANMPQELFDLQGAIADQFGKIEKEMKAWASADGTSSGTKEFIPSEAFLTTAEVFATEPNAQYALEQQFKELTPEKQAQIDADAKRYGTNRNTAMAVDAAKALYDRTRRTAQSEQVSEGGAGRKDKDASARELLETGFGIASGIAQGRKIREVSRADAEQVDKLIKKYPKIGRFDAYDDEVITNYNNLYYDTQVLADGKEIPAKVRGIIRDKKSGDVRVVYGTDEAGTDVTITEKIPEKEFYSKVIRRIALNTPEYDINTLDRIAQDEYNLIQGSGGQIDLPKVGGGNPVDNTLGGKWGSKAAANKYN